MPCDAAIPLGVSPGSDRVEDRLRACGDDSDGPGAAARQHRREQYEGDGYRDRVAPDGDEACARAQRCRWKVVCGSPGLDVSHVKA